jgi:outer membrane biosynthesis protein TonB
VNLARLRRPLPLVAALAAVVLFAGTSGADQPPGPVASGPDTPNPPADGRLGAGPGQPAFDLHPAWDAGSPASAPPAAYAPELAASGIPVVALTAYRRAEARMAKAMPTCHIPWYLIAGIGRVESDHGRFGGAQLLRDGTSVPKIIGVALDGQHGFALIRDTDHGRYDGDTAYDRAVGPMQFIPGTWAEYATDGDGDGTDDPFNVNDAALAAAVYLCNAGGDLSNEAGRSAAVHSYNHSAEYVALVLAIAAEYQRGVTNLPTPPPGTGPLPKPPTGTPPPVSVGPPRAGQPDPKPTPTPTPSPTSPPTTPTATPTQTSTPTATPSPSPTGCPPTPSPTATGTSGAAPSRSTTASSSPPSPHSTPTAPTTPTVPSTPTARASATRSATPTATCGS